VIHLVWYCSRNCMNLICLRCCCESVVWLWIWCVCCLKFSLCKTNWFICDLNQFISSLHLISLASRFIKVFQIVKTIFRGLNWRKIFLSSIHPSSWTQPKTFSWCLEHVRMNRSYSKGLRISFYYMHIALGLVSHLTMLKW